MAQNSKTQTRLGAAASYLGVLALTAQYLAVAPELNIMTITGALTAALASVFGTNQAAKGPSIKE